MNSIKLIPIKVERQTSQFNLMGCLLDSLDKNSQKLYDSDILTISSKFVSLSEGRFVKLSDIAVSPSARKISKKYNINPHLSELIYRESDKIFSGSNGFVLTFKNKVIVPNAGIDTSNIMNGYAILYPENPFKSAENIKSEIQKLFQINISVVITDSRLMPSRIGTTGVAIASAGIEPIHDERGKTDLFGNSMRVTQKAIADDISSAAQLLMGECNESIPIVIIRDSDIQVTENKAKISSFYVEPDECIFIKGLSESKS